VKPCERPLRVLGRFAELRPFEGCLGRLLATAENCVEVPFTVLGAEGWSTPKDNKDLSVQRSADPAPSTELHDEGPFQPV
jgi:hypothetical protein